MCRGANNSVDKLLPHFPRGFNNALNDVLVPPEEPTYSGKFLSDERTVFTRPLPGNARRIYGSALFNVG